MYRSGWSSAALRNWCAVCVTRPGRRGDLRRARRDRERREGHDRRQCQPARDRMTRHRVVLSKIPGTSAGHAICHRRDKTSRVSTRPTSRELYRALPPRPARRGRVGARAVPHVAARAGGPRPPRRGVGRGGVRRARGHRRWRRQPRAVDPPLRASRRRHRSARRAAARRSGARARDPRRHRGGACAPCPARSSAGPCQRARRRCGTWSSRLRAIYCGTTGYDFAHIFVPEERDWLRDAVETGRVPRAGRSDRSGGAARAADRGRGRSSASCTARSPARRASRSKASTCSCRSSTRSSRTRPKRACGRRSSAWRIAAG